MSREFFNITSIDRVFELISSFATVGTETVPLLDATGRILAEQIVSDIDLPGFDRSTVDGYAVRAADTFGASEANPAYLVITGSVGMGEKPSRPVAAGEAIRIATGGMLPEGTDSVEMIEYTSEIDGQTLEVYKRIAPGTHVVKKNEDLEQGAVVLREGTRIRPQEAGVLAALGKTDVKVYRKPVIGVISTGDELVPADCRPEPGQIRDVNTYSISSGIRSAGAISRPYGIVADDLCSLSEVARQAVAETDMVIISGGSSVGTRDLTIEVIETLAESKLLVHGIPVRPGKPTILAGVGEKAFWGLPGHVTSAMVVFEIFVKSMIRHIGGHGLPLRNRNWISAVLTRNLASAQGRTDYVRVRLVEKENKLYAEPILGSSGLIRTMIEAEGLIEIHMNTEGLEKGSRVRVIPI